MLSVLAAIVSAGGPARDTVTPLFIMGARGVADASQFREVGNRSRRARLALSEYARILKGTFHGPDGQGLAGRIAMMGA